MAMIKKSITITDKHAEFIQAQIASGDFTSDSEVIRDALRFKLEYESETDFLRAKLKAARESGISDKTPEEIRQSVLKRLKANGKI